MKDREIVDKHVDLILETAEMWTAKINGVIQGTSHDPAMIEDRAQRVRMYELRGALIHLADTCKRLRRNGAVNDGK